jgi:polyhydroxyalkanoate synthase subunit PhaC
MPAPHTPPLPPGGDALLATLLPFAMAGGEPSRLFLTGMGAALAKDPARLRAFLDRAYERQFALWRSVLDATAIPGADTMQPTRDPRSRDPAWYTIPWFAFLRQQHALWEAFVAELADLLELPDVQRQRVAFFLMQWVEATWPGNHLAANPAALRQAVATDGASVKRGAELLAADAARGRITMSDPEGFRVGVDLAVTPGHVIHETPLAQLIRYAPAGGKVRGRPLLIVPPFVNRYYILDLRPENSFVRHAVSQGFDVFMVSWRDVGADQAGAGWDDYLREGVLEPLAVALQLSGSRRAAVLGYCIGGTLAAAAAALDASAGRSRIASLTLLATLLDFASPGDIGHYVDTAFVEHCEREFGRGGVVPGERLAAAFSSLRARDLVWHFVQHNYLLGATPPPMDLLHWNGDSANLPGPLYCQVLRLLYLENRLRAPGGIITAFGAIDLLAIDAPVYLLAARDDHIVPWRSAHASTKLLQRVEQFVLAESGHVAGIVNPSGDRRRGFWSGPPPVTTADEWIDTAQHTTGSWWQHWAGWQARHAGRWHTAPASPGDALHPVIEPSPGRYVLEHGEPVRGAGDDPGIQ